MKSSGTFKTLLIVAVSLIFIIAADTGVNADVDKTGWASQLRFMSGPPGGSWEALGTALSDTWTASGLPKTASLTGGGVSNILNVHAKRGDLGFSVASLLGAAVKGEADFKNRVVDNAVIMANIYTQYTYFVMRKDFAQKNNIKSVEDIINKKTALRFATLKPGTSSEFIVKALFEKGYGFDYKKNFQDWGGSVEYVSYSGGTELLADNHLDCFAFSIGRTASTLMNIENQVDVVLLPVGQDALDKLSDAYGTVTFTVAPGIYKSLPEGSEPVKVVGDYTCIVVRKDLPESLVRELNRVLWEHKGELANAVSDIEELAPETALPEKIPAHEGSVKFWKGLSR